MCINKCDILNSSEKEIYFTEIEFEFLKFVLKKKKFFITKSELLKYSKYSIRAAGNILGTSSGTILRFCKLYNIHPWSNKKTCIK